MLDVLPAADIAYCHLDSIDWLGNQVKHAVIGTRGRCGFCHDGSLLKVDLCCRDLLDGDAPGTGKEAALSKHERQQRRMQERIAKLEAQNMAEKDWFMQGESGAGTCQTDILLLVPH